jgi:hypothetical protein
MGFSFNNKSKSAEEAVTVMDKTVTLEGGKDGEVTKTDNLHPELAEREMQKELDKTKDHPVIPLFRFRDKYYQLLISYMDEIIKYAREIRNENGGLPYEEILNFLSILTEKDINHLVDLSIMRNKNALADEEKRLSFELITCFFEKKLRVKYNISEEETITVEKYPEYHEQKTKIVESFNSFCDKIIHWHGTKQFPELYFYNKLKLFVDTSSGSEDYGSGLSLILVYEQKIDWNNDRRSEEGLRLFPEEFGEENLFGLSLKEKEAKIKIIENDINKQKDKIKKIFDLCIGSNSKSHMNSIIGLKNMINKSPINQKEENKNLENFLNGKKGENRVYIARYTWKSNKDYIIYMKMRNIDYEDAASAEREFFSTKKLEEIENLTKTIKINNSVCTFEINLSIIPDIGFYIYIIGHYNNSIESLENKFGEEFLGFENKKEKKDLYSELKIEEKCDALLAKITPLFNKLQQYVKKFYDSSKAKPYFEYFPISKYKDKKYGYEYDKNNIKDKLKESNEKYIIFLKIPLQYAKDTLANAEDKWDDIVVDLLPSVRDDFKKKWKQSPLSDSTVSLEKEVYGQFDEEELREKSLAKPDKIFGALIEDHWGYIGAGDGDEVETFSLAICCTYTLESPISTENYEQNNIENYGLEDDESGDDEPSSEDSEEGEGDDAGGDMDIGGDDFGGDEGEGDDEGGDEFGGGEDEEGGGEDDFGGGDDDSSEDKKDKPGIHPFAEINGKTKSGNEFRELISQIDRVLGAVEKIGLKNVVVNKLIELKEIVKDALRIVYITELEESLFRYSMYVKQFEDLMASLKEEVKKINKKN